MRTTFQRFLVVGAAALVVVGLVAGPSQAQPIGRGARVLGNSMAFARPWYYQPNPIYQYQLNQYANTVATLGRAYSYVPPYAMGYNPYAGYLNYGPMYSPLYNPYAYTNPYLYSGYYGAYYNPYGLYANPYLYYYP
jgi:hypothetical protein